MLRFSWSPISLALALALFSPASAGQQDVPSQKTVPANLDAKFRRGVFFNGTFNRPKGGLYRISLYVPEAKGLPDNRIDVDTVSSKVQLWTVDLTPKTYLVVPFAQIYNLSKEAFGFDAANPTGSKPGLFASLSFITFAHWHITRIEGSGVTSEIPFKQDAEPRDQAFSITFGIANTYGQYNQLFAFIKLNRACPSSGGTFKVQFDTGKGTTYEQTVTADKEPVYPLVNPTSAQHKSAQAVLNSKTKPAVDEFLVDLNIPMATNLHLVGSQEISSNNYDTSATYEADFLKVIQNSYTVSNGYQPLGFFLGGTANQLFTNKVIRGGMYGKTYFRKPLAGFIERGDLADLYVPPFPIEKAGNMPWMGINIDGSYIAERDPRISPEGNSRFYTYIKPEASMVIDQLRGSATLIPSGIGLDLDGKAWWFLSGRENAGNNVRATEYYAHVLFTLKFGTSNKGYFGYEIGTNEANGFQRTQGWAIGLNLKF